MLDDKALYSRMLEASLVDAGNNARLKRFLEKARRGETVRIGAIGGSITEGAGAETFQRGYVFQFAEAVGRIWCGGAEGRVRLVNGGLGGTPSSLGVMRYRRDVLDDFGGESPDLLLIEFSVNDHDECTGGRAYEALIRDALRIGPDTAVILVFSVFPGLRNLQDSHIPLGRHYSLPMASVRDAIAGPYMSGRMTDKDYFADIYHPVTAGHTLMCDCLLHLVRRADASPADRPAPLPDHPLLGAGFCGTLLLTAANTRSLVQPGGFDGTDTQIQRFVTRGRLCFPDNWHHAPGQAGDPGFRADLTCRNILMDYKLSKSADFGTAEAYVDGRLSARIDACSPEGWNNNKVALLLDDDTPARHTLEIRMAAGSEDRSFTILALGCAGMGEGAPR